MLRSYQMSSLFDWFLRIIQLWPYLQQFYQEEAQKKNKIREENKTIVEEDPEIDDQDKSNEEDQREEGGDSNVGHARKL